MLLIRGLKTPTDASQKTLTAAAAKKLRLSLSDVLEIKPIKKSLDARKKDDIHYVWSLAVTVKGDEASVIAHTKNPNVSIYSETVYEIPNAPAEAARPLVVGFGPAGMFAALVLARAGARPVVVERGRPALERQAAVEAFRQGGALDSENNVQFGEGGAGTFSDGKLNTGIKDPRMGWMLSQFASHGAPESICYDAKPHIGTDILIDVVQNIRREIISLGGEIRFNTKLTRLMLDAGTLTGAELECSGVKEILACNKLILAVGHSARDTFETLYYQGVAMEPKGFSMGVRIEHLQADVNNAQYGDAVIENLPPADYALNVHFPDRESAYTFCMCPGGEVFAAASEQGGVVTNGMSYSRRDGKNANSALLVTLHPEDFPDRGVLSGMYWQRDIEQAAYAYGGGNYLAPAQLAGDFLAGRVSTGAGKVQPSYRPGVIWGDIHDVLPPRICGVLERALPELGKKLKGFDDPDAVLTAPETRSSSPVRILRGLDLQSEIKGLYPCGEGAGYAGGISSAAIDGMRCAEAVIRDMQAAGI